MITHSDPAYQATKLIKQGRARLVSPFDELAHWIENKWDVPVLNVIYDAANELHAPRLEVILEHNLEALSFRQGLNFDSDKQLAIANRFLQVIERERRNEFDAKGLFVVFSAFSPIAMEEADGRVSDDQIHSLKERIGNPELWEVSRCFGRVTFFFFTDEQMRRHESQGKKAEYARMYFAILKPHDEFGYLSERNLDISFDSKQNFDEVYRGSWFNYYR